MKLSDKGKRKILDNPYWFMNEFEPDDFEGCVVLTVEEAKRIAKKLNDVGLQHEVDFGDFDYDALDLAESLSERIEQAEMSKQST